MCPDCICGHSASVHSHPDGIFGISNNPCLCSHACKVEGCKCRAFKEKEVK
jgi:hypothetical protein